MPAKKVALFGELERTRILELDSRPTVHLFAEPGYTALFENVLQPRVLPVRPVAEIAVDRYHRLCGGFHLLGREKSNHIRYPRKRFRIPMAHPEPSSANQII